MVDPNKRRALFASLNNDGTDFEVLVFNAPSKAFLEDQKKLAEAHVKAKQQKTWIPSHQHTYSTPVPAPAREFREFCNIAIGYCMLTSLQEPPSFQQNNSSSTGSPTDSILRQSTHHYASLALTCFCRTKLPPNPTRK